jgi:hypothetical protein
LPRTWIASVNRLRELYPTRRYYWLLIASGFRTYRFLPLFWKLFYPRFDAGIPDDMRGLRDDLAANRFGAAYDAGKGIVRFSRPQVLRNELLDVPSARLTDPHVAFFLRSNPGYVYGDELVCITELCEANLTPAGRRMWGADGCTRAAG